MLRNEKLKNIIDKKERVQVYKFDEYKLELGGWKRIKDVEMYIFWVGWMKGMMMIYIGWMVESLVVSCDFWKFSAI